MTISIFLLVSSYSYSQIQLINVQELRLSNDTKINTEIKSYMLEQLNNCTIQDFYSDVSFNHVYARKKYKELLYSVFLYKVFGVDSCKRYSIDLILSTSNLKSWDFNSLLATFEITTAVSLAFDMLKPDLSIHDIKKVTNSIVKLGLDHYIGKYWWKEENTNWKQIISSSALIGAMVTYESNKAFSKKIIQESIHNLNETMSMYFPDGGYPEGVNYWGYGTSYSVMALYFFNKFPNKLDQELKVPSSFLNSVHYYSSMIGNSGYTYNYSDSGKYKLLNPFILWLAQKNDAPWLVNQEIELLKSVLSDVNTSATYNDIYIPFYLLWLKNIDHLDSGAQEPMGVNIFRGRNTVGSIKGKSEDGVDFFLGVKGGSPSVNHGHMDVGSFVLDIDGIRWFEDIGNPKSYKEVLDKGISLWNRRQYSSRWNLIETGVIGHSILSLGNKNQRVNADIDIQILSHLPLNTIGFHLDLAPSMQSYYIPGNFLFDISRKFKVKNYKILEIEDLITPFFSNEKFIWSGITTSDVEFIDNNTIMLNKGGKSIIVKISYEAYFSVRAVDLMGEYKKILIEFKAVAEGKSSLLLEIYQL